MRDPRIRPRTQAPPRRHRSSPVPRQCDSAPGKQQDSPALRRGYGGISRPVSCDRAGYMAGGSGRVLHGLGAPDHGINSRQITRFPVNPAAAALNCTSGSFFGVGFVEVTTSTMGEPCMNSTLIPTMVASYFVDAIRIPGVGVIAPPVL